MEVRAHTHTARKKWTHYFWEFIMLFLAVLCSFFGREPVRTYDDHKLLSEYASLVFLVQQIQRQAIKNNYTLA